MLHDPARHEALDGPPWSETLARDGLRRLVAALQAQRHADGSWPVHPLDDEGDSPAGGFKSLYLGRSGLLWALGWLQQQGAATLTLDPLAGLQQAHADYLAAPDTGRVEPSYFMGEVGVLLPLWWLGRSDAVADRLHAVVRANLAHPSNECFSGAPGTLRAAAWLWQATQQPRWRDLVLEHIDSIWAGWIHDERVPGHLWTQSFAGSTVQYYGAGHGMAGNVATLLQVQDLLDDDRRGALRSRVTAVLGCTATRDGDAVNWRGGTYMPRSGRVDLLLQWCHGAPGIVLSLAAVAPGLDAELDAMLLAAGQAIWRAGPLAKGPGLCHGTAGNGQALLALYRRTGQALWLDRARAFAMHALQQADDAQQAHGMCRPTLWTGDAGLAVFLWQCIQGRAGMPSLDFL